MTASITADLERYLTSAPPGSYQLYVSVAGEPLVEVAVGADGRGVAATTATLMPWLCATKAATALASLQLVDENAVALDDEVASVLPSAPRDVTLRDLLEHRVHFEPDPPAAALARPTGSNAIEIAARSAVHRSAGYSEWVGFTLLGGVIEALTGMEVGTAIRSRLFLPLGMEDSWLSTSAKEVLAYGDRIPVPGGDDLRSKYLAVGDQPEFAASRSAATGGRGPASDLGRMYEALAQPGYASVPQAALAELSDAWAATRTAVWSDRSIGHWRLPVPRWRAGLLVDPGCFGLNEGRVVGQSGDNGIAFLDMDLGLVLVLLGDHPLSWDVNLALAWHLVERLYTALGHYDRIARADGSKRRGRRSRHGIRTA